MKTRQHPAAEDARCAGRWPRPDEADAIVITRFVQNLVHGLKVGDEVRPQFRGRPRKVRVTGMVNEIVTPMLYANFVVYEAGLVRSLEPRVFAHAFIHALHSMAMVELLSGDDEFYVTGAKEMAAFIGLFWSGLKSDKPARRKGKAR